jgi:hypothetical protein
MERFEKKDDSNKWLNEWMNEWMNEWTNGIMIYEK